MVYIWPAHGETAVGSMQVLLKRCHLLLGATLKAGRAVLAAPFDGDHVPQRSAQPAEARHRRRLPFPCPRHSPCCRSCHPARGGAARREGELYVSLMLRSCRVRAMFVPHGRPRPSPPLLTWLVALTARSMCSFAPDPESCCRPARPRGTPGSALRTLVPPPPNTLNQPLLQASQTAWNTWSSQHYALWCPPS